jgi:hypothetical protein
MTLQLKDAATTEVLSNRSLIDRLEHSSSDLLLVGGGIIYGF